MTKLRYSEEHVVSIIFILLIFIFMLGSIFNIGIKAINPQKINPEAAIENIDMAINQAVANEKHPANIADVLKNAIHAVDTKFSNNMLLRLKLIDLNGFVQMVMNKNVVNDASPDNAVIKSSDGMLHFLTKDLDITDYCNNIQELNDFCTSQNIPLLYVLTPPKVIGNYTKLPTGIFDYSNNIANKMDGMLKLRNVKVMDLREVAEVDHLNKKDMFYITDHHWTYQTAFWAFSKIVAELNTSYGFNINKDYIDLNNYQTVNYGKWFLGAEGARVGKYYAGVDDFSIILPSFQTNMKVRNSLGGNKYIAKYGNFQDAIISQSILEKYKDYNDLYHVYLTENYQETIIMNRNKNVDNKKILIIKDSFGLPVSAFLSLTCLETRLLDLRAFSSFNLYNYINEYKPDSVMFIYNPAFNNSKKFTFK